MSNFKHELTFRAISRQYNHRERKVIFVSSSDENYFNRVDEGYYYTGADLNEIVRGIKSRANLKILTESGKFYLKDESQEEKYVIEADKFNPKIVYEIVKHVVKQKS